MYSPTKALSADNVVRYFEKEYTKSYYSGDETGETEGQWWGRGAERLGLRGKISLETLGLLAEGKSPEGRELIRKSKRQDVMEHRAAWDFTVGVPKSFSILELAGGDERLTHLFQESLGESLSYLEQFAEVRAGAKRNESRRTGELVAGVFVHNENRNLEPHKHAHVLLFNMTYDEKAPNSDGTRGGWRALQTRKLFAVQKQATRVFWAALAKGATDLGYTVEIDEETGAPEIREVPKTLRQYFSTRRLEVEERVALVKSYYDKLRRELLEKAELARKAGDKISAEQFTAQAERFTWNRKSAAMAAQNAARNTREEKIHGIDPLALREKWKEEALEQGVDLDLLLKNALERSRGPEKGLRPSGTTTDLAKTVLDLVLEHMTHHECVVRLEDVIEEALKPSLNLGKVTLSQLETEIANRVEREEILIGKSSKGDVVLTLRSLVALEEQIFDLGKQGKGSVESVGTDDQRQEAAHAVSPEGLTLNSGQRKAFHLVTGTSDQFILIHGKAGVGKSTAFRHVAGYLTGHGYVVRAFAPTTQAVGVLRDDGLTADTVQSHLVALDRGYRAQQKEIWILDEVGLMGVRDLARFMEGAAKAGVRVAFSGDRRQFASVPAGRVLDQLIEGRHLECCEIDEIVRQKAAPKVVREAVEEISEGRIETALRSLREAGRVIEIKDDTRRVQALALRYTELDGETIVLCATNEERRVLNETIRRARIVNGEVDYLTEARTEIYSHRHISPPYRKLAQSYEVGNMVRFYNTAGHRELQKGTWYKVVGRDMKRNLVTVQHGRKKISYDPRHFFGIEDIYAEERRSFSVGDKVRFRAKEESLNIKVGDSGVITKVKGDVLTVEDKRGRVTEVDLKEYKTIDLGYAVTGHSGQGVTCDNAIVYQMSKKRDSVVNTSSAYVGISRAKREVFVYVDAFESATQDMARVYKKSAAHDVGLSSQQSRAPGKSQAGQREEDLEMSI